MASKRIHRSTGGSGSSKINKRVGRKGSGKVDSRVQKKNTGAPAGGNPGIPFFQHPSGKG